MVAELEPHLAPARLISKLATQPSWAHGQAPFCGDLVRYPSLASNNNLGNNNNNNNNKSLGGTGRQASWELSSGGAPTLRSLGSESASSWHIALLAMEECMTKEPELATKTHMLASLESDGDLVLLLDSFNQVTQQGFELGKGLVNLDHVRQEACTTACKQNKEKQTACSSTACRQTAEQATQASEKMQLDQARLHKDQLRSDPQQSLSSQQKLEQENKQNNIGSNSLRTKSLGPACNNSNLGNNSLGIGDQQECKESLELQPLAFSGSSLQVKKILLDTGAELSVAPWDFAAEIPLSPLQQDLKLQTADGRAIKIFGVRTVQLLTSGFSFSITFVIADVCQPLLGLGSLLRANLSLQLNKNLGHHLGNIAGEKIQLEQWGLQLYLSACPVHLELNPCIRGSLLKDSLVPEANLVPKEKQQLRKEVSNQGEQVRAYP